MLSSALQRLLASARADELRRAAASDPRIRRPPTSPGPDAASTVTLRFAFPDDDVAVCRLAVLDSSQPPAGSVLLAEVGGELRAALSLHERRVIADPFRWTAGLIELLHARARQLETPPSRVRRLRPERIPFRHGPSPG
jgi:hypothetical protein